MRSKNNSIQADTPSTIIGKGITLEAARLTGQESVRIDGNFTGDIDMEGTLILGDTSHVTGNVHARYIIAAGLVEGHLRCDTVLHMAASARIIGDVETQALIVDEGSQISGKYKVGSDMPDISDGNDKTALRRTSPWPAPAEELSE